MKTLIASLAMALGVACSTSTGPTPVSSEFVIEHVGERFVVRLTDPATIALARANLRGQNQTFPSGPLRRGDGGFNAPWTWHLDPDQTRFVEVAIEVCDGRASYVESHQSEYSTYCPWGAKVIAER
jgi:hypothetical protein